MFDWVTWSIWFVGLVILIVWIIVPMKEFIGIIKAQHAAHRQRIASGGDGPSEGEARRDA
jgi:uncharacterized membrane protein YcjF (UPF0283 family)